MDMESADRSVKLFALLQRQSGVSRRKAQDLIASGEVTLAGRAVLDPFCVVAPGEVDALSLRGHPLSLRPPELRVYRYHKPRGVLCSHDDPHEGNTVGRVLRAEGFIGYSWAGRLDQDAEGLLLLTNDGLLLNQLSHPRHEITKTYRVWLDRMPEGRDLEGVLRRMKDGIEDEGDRLRILGGRPQGTPPHIVLELAEGKKREIKRLFAHFHLEVVRLLRVAIGPVELAALPPGALERLTEDEMRILQEAVSEA